MIVGRRGLAVFVTIFPLVASFTAVPLLVASHKLVKGLREELSGSNLERHSSDSATNLVKRLATECSSDAYIILDQPGLRVEDLNMKRAEEWPFLRKYMTMASTVVGLPWVLGTLDLDYFERYIVKNCEAETVNVEHENEDELTQYVDTRTRIIRVKFGELPPTNERGERNRVLREHDELIRKIIRKVPSPHYTIILTSQQGEKYHNVPNSVMQSRPEHFEIFNDIVNDPGRENEVERNDMFRSVDPVWSPDRNTVNRYIRNKKKDEIHFFDADLWIKNEKLVITVFVMILSLFALQVTKLFSGIITKVFKKDRELIGHPKTD